MDAKETIGQRETISTGISTTTMTTIVERSENVAAAVPDRVGSKDSATTNSGQRPKILMYESTVTSKNDTSVNELSIEVLTDDDTNSVGSSIDAEFIHITDTNNESKQVERVGTELESLSISTSIDQLTTQDKSRDDSLMNLSHQFTGLDLLRKPEAVKDEEHSAHNYSALTLSSGDSEGANDKSKVMTDDGRKSSIITLSDTDDESINQPPLKIIPRPMEDYNVSSSLPAEALANLPSSTLMHKMKKFFDNVPSLNESVSSEHLDKTNEPENESIYVSETTVGDDDSESASHHEPSIDQGNKSSRPDETEANRDSAERSLESVVPETEAGDEAIEDELAGVNEMRNVPLTKSSSDQARPVVKTLSGIKLTTTNSTPIIESTVRDADGVKRSNSNNVSAIVKNTGSSIKFNAGSNGQLNIAAKININIQISNHDTSTSEDSSPEQSMKEEASLETPAIESEAFAETDRNSQNESFSSDSENSLPPTQAKSVASSPEQQPPPQARPDRGCDTPKTPSVIQKIKTFEFVAPKSMTKAGAADASGYETPKRKMAAVQQDKENELPEELPDGFQIDKSIGVDPKDQLLLHQVYGEAWKTPEVLRCYSTVKGRPIATEPKRMVQSAHLPHQSRVSRGFNVCK